QALQPPSSYQVGARCLLPATIPQPARPPGDSAALFCILRLTARIVRSDTEDAADRPARSPGIFQLPAGRDLSATKLQLYPPLPCRFSLYQIAAGRERSCHRVRPILLSKLAFELHWQGFLIALARPVFFPAMRKSMPL